MAEATTANTSTEKVKKKSWWNNMKAEFNKIIWPTKQDLIKQTVAVVIVSIVLCVLITIIDQAVLYFVNLLVGIG